MKKKRKTKDIILHKKCIVKNNEMPMLRELLAKDGRLYSTDLETTLATETELPDGIYRTAGNDFVKGLCNASHFPIIDELTKGNCNEAKISGEIKREIECSINAVDLKRVETRPSFQGILFIIENDKVQIIGTDGTTLSKSTIENVKIVGGNGKFLIPIKSLQVLLRDAFTEDITIEFGEKHSRISNGNITIYSINLPSTYPDVEEVLVRSVEKQMIFDKKELLDALKILKFYSDDSYFKVELILKDGKYLFHSENHDKKIEKTIPIRVETLNSKKIDASNQTLIMPLRPKDDDTENLVVAYDLKKLTKILKNVDCEKVCLAMKKTNLDPTILYSCDY